MTCQVRHRLLVPLSVIPAAKTIASECDLLNVGAGVDLNSNTSEKSETSAISIISAVKIKCETEVEDSTR